MSDSLFYDAMVYLSGNYRRCREWEFACVVITISRLGINRVWLPILLVVS